MPVALILLIGTTFIFALADAVAKLAVSTLPPVEILFIRSVVVVLITVPLAWHRIGAQVFHSKRPGLQFARGGAVLCSSYFFVTGLTFLPLADASAINFIWPVLITVFAVLLLGETVGVRRWSATLVGFVGMLLIVQPGTSAFQPAALYPLAAGLMWSLATVLTRKIAANDRAETTIVWSSIVMLLGASLIIPYSWVMPTYRELGLSMFIGVLSVIGHSMMIYALERAAASQLAPFSYLQLVWATSLGYLIWGSVPDLWIITGSALIVASGIYTAHRERVRARLGQ